MRRMTKRNGMRKVARAGSLRPERDDGEDSIIPWVSRYLLVVVPLITVAWLALVLWSPGWISPDFELMAKLVIGLAAGVVIAAAGALVSRDEL